MADYYKPVSVGARREGNTDQRYVSLPDGTLAPVIVAVDEAGNAIGGGSGGGGGGNVYTPSNKPPVSGTFGSTGNSPAFSPIAGRSFNIVLSGTWTGSVILTRSLNGGTNFYPLTAMGFPVMSFTGNASEQWSDDESGTQYRLECKVLTTGSISYRISQ